MKRRVLMVLGLLVVSTSAFAQTPAEDPIERALAPAPRAMKEGATVIKWKPDFTYDTLRKGTNTLVCYDQSGWPNEQPFSVQCTSLANLERVAQNTIDYYESVLVATGAEQVRDSVRLFMAPGVDHCSGGEGTFAIDTLGVIDTWVESGTPPERIVASRPLKGSAERTRPLCPYPQVARYRGQGSTDDASNFVCAAAPAR